VHHLSVENGLLLLCCADLRPGGVEETWGRCVVYTRWTNPLLLSRKNSKNSVLCLALVAIMSHGAAVSMLQVFCPFASSSLMSNAKPRARSGVVFFPLSPAHPPACLLGSFISGLVRMNQSSGVGIVGFVCLWCSWQCLCDCGGINAISSTHWDCWRCLLQAHESTGTNQIICIWC
jgi:hypothetical protein